MKESSLDELSKKLDDELVDSKQNILYQYIKID